MCRERHAGANRPLATGQASREKVAAFQCY